MSWKFVFNSNNICGTKEHVAKVARECGYKFFTFNGDVFFVDRNRIVHETDITTKDLF